MKHLRTACGCSEVRQTGGRPDERRGKAVMQALKNGISIRLLSGRTGISKAIIERIAGRR